MKTSYVDMPTRSIADLVDYYGLGMLITRINVPKASRGAGHARRLLAKILQDADRERVTLYLEITPSGGLDFQQLEAWYLRHGFEEFTTTGGLYRRIPRNAK